MILAVSRGVNPKKQPIDRIKQTDLSSADKLDEIRERFAIKYANANVMGDMYFMNVTGEQTLGVWSPFNPVRDDYSRQIGPYTV